MPTIHRKPARLAREARAFELMKKDPQPAAILAERLGLDVSIISRLARRHGIVLPATEYVSLEEVKRFSEENCKWGPTGHVYRSKQPSKNRRLRSNVKAKQSSRER
jgi:hypothetical protein